MNCFFYITEIKKYDYSLINSFLSICTFHSINKHFEGMASCLSLREVQEAAKLGQSLLNKTIDLEELVSFLQNRNEIYAKEISQLKDALLEMQNANRIIQMKLSINQSATEILNASDDTFASQNVSISDEQWAELNALVLRQQQEIDMLRRQLNMRELSQSNLCIANINCNDNNNADIVELTVYKNTKKWWKIKKTPFAIVNIRITTGIELRMKELNRSFDEFVIIVNNKIQMNEGKLLRQFKVITRKKRFEYWINEIELAKISAHPKVMFIED